MVEVAEVNRKLGRPGLTHRQATQKKWFMVVRRKLRGETKRLVEAKTFQEAGRCNIHTVVSTTMAFRASYSQSSWFRAESSWFHFILAGELCITFPHLRWKHRMSFAHVAC